MKCPRCWADKAYLHQFRGWWETALGCLAFRPMKCNHCYHRFLVHWVFTFGKSTAPPVLRVTRHKPNDSKSRSTRRRGPGPRRKNAA